MAGFAKMKNCLLVAIPHLDLAPAGRQRVERREAILNARRTKPILVFDFRNDGDSVDGCIVWGRRYARVAARGYVEPCVFVRFAKDSVHEKTLGECLRSDAFRRMRLQAPFDGDRRRPCPQIDHPRLLRAAGRMKAVRRESGALAAAGDYAGAMHALLLRGVEEMRGRLGVSFASSLTSREILNQFIATQGARVFKEIGRLPPDFFENLLMRKKPKNVLTEPRFCRR